MSAAEVAETTALFPPQQARLRLPRVPGTLPTLPVMACGEKPLFNGALSPGRTASSTGLSAGLSWHRRLHGRSRQQPKLEPLREENKTLPVSERTASGLNGSNAKIPTGAPTQKKGASKLSPRSRPEDWNKSKKENSELAIRRVKVSQTSGVKNSGKQRMSYPPCTGCGATQSEGLEDLSTVKQTISCPVLCDLDNLTITPKLSVPSPSSKCQSQTDKAMSRLVMKHQHHKIKQESSKRHGDLDRLRVPDANGNRPRQRKSRNARDESRNQRPKPPSWQDLPNEQPTAGASTQDAFTTHAYAVPESVHSVSAYRCDSATTRSTLESERRAVRANIRRTRSRVIDSKEIPKAETVLPLSQTKPSEFNLRKTYHDDTVYLVENAQRCRKWLAALEESDVTPHWSQSGVSSHHVDGQNDADETVMCDIEISHDKWNFLGSPYPTSSDCSSDDP